MPTAKICFAAPESRRQAIVAKLPGATIVKDLVIVPSALSSDEPLNHHLVWLWGVMKNERRFIKSLLTEGVQLICQCYAKKDEIVLKPNAAEMLHILNMDLEINIW